MSDVQLTVAQAAEISAARVIAIGVAQRCAGDESTQRYSRMYQAALLGAAEALTIVSDDVKRLVVAAREVAFGPIADSVRHEAEFFALIEELDAASEAFAARVPWEDAPRDRDGGSAGDPQGLHCEAAPARAEGIAHIPDSDPKTWKKAGAK